jgi:hypothetical protein
MTCGTWARARAGAWSRTAVDLHSLCLIVAMRRVGRGAGWCLVPYSRRFTLSVTGGCLAALAPREGGGRRWGGGGGGRYMGEAGGSAD